MKRLNYKGKGKGTSKTAETSFIENEERTSLVRLKIIEAHRRLEQMFVGYGENGKFLALRYDNEKGKVFVINTEKGGKQGEYPLFKPDGETLNKLPKGIMKFLGERIQDAVEKRDTEIEQVNQSLREDSKILEDENVQPEEKEQVKKRMKNTLNERGNIVRERNALEEKLPLRERIKMIFKRYGLSVAAITLSVSAIISTITAILLKELKTVGKNVGNGLKEVGKKLANILPGLIGTIIYLPTLTPWA